MTDYKVSLVYNTGNDSTTIIIEDEDGKIEWLWTNEFSRTVNMKIWHMISQVVRWAFVAQGDEE